MVYIILIIIAATILIINFAINGKELLAPTNIICASYLLSLFFALVGRKYWNDEAELNSTIITIYIVGLGSFFIGELLARLIRFGKNKKQTQAKNINVKKVSMDKLKIITGMLLIIACGVYLLVDIKKMCFKNFYFYDKIPYMINFFRSRSSMFNSGNGLSFSFFSNQLIKVNNVVCVLFMYALLANLFNKEKKNRYWYIAVVVLAFGASVFTSGRSAIVRLLICALMISFRLIYAKLSETRTTMQINMLFVKILVVSATVILPLFYIALPLFGRGTNAGMVKYISFYLGCPTPSLSVFLNNYIEEITQFRGESLTGLKTALSKLHILEYNGASYLEFISELHLHSNVYTSFRRPYVDFGLLGVAVSHFLFGFIYTKLYLKYMYSNNIFWILFYSFYAAYLFDAARDNAFTSMFVSLNTIIYVVLFIFIEKFFFENLIEDIIERVANRIYKEEEKNG